MNLPSGREADFRFNKEPSERRRVFIIYGEVGSESAFRD